MVTRPIENGYRIQISDLTDQKNSNPGPKLNQIRPEYRGSWFLLDKHLESIWKDNNNENNNLSYEPCLKVDW